MNYTFNRPDWLINRKQAWEILGRYAETSRYGAGSWVYVEDDPCDHFYCLVNGSIEITKQTTKDNTKILGVLSNGNFFGVPEIFQGVHVVNARCIVDCEIARFSSKVYFSTVAADETLSLYFQHMMGSIIGDLQRALVLENAELKVVSYLNWLMKRKGREGDGGEVFIPVRPRHETIARITQLTRETVSRVLGTLKDAGVISMEADMIVVHDAGFIDSRSWSDDPAAGYYGTDTG
jgi:CRP-like cAMP-binding protein